MFNPTSAPVWPSANPNGNNVVARRRHAGHHDALADAHELMNRDMPAEKREIANADVAAEHHIIGKSHVVADLAIVTDMRADHEEQRSPMRVMPPPSSVPVFMVTPSRNSQRVPMTSRVGPPR